MDYNKGKKVDECSFNTIFTMVFTATEWCLRACKAAQEYYGDMEEQEREEKAGAFPSPEISSHS